MLSFMLFYIGSIYKKYIKIKIKTKPVSDLFQLEVQERKECGFFSGPSFTVYYHFYGWTKDMFFGSLFTFLCTDPRYVFWQSPFVSAFQVS